MKKLFPFFPWLVVDRFDLRLSTSAMNMHSGTPPKIQD
jgi:hypothetical protein